MAKVITNVKVDGETCEIKFYEIVDGLRLNCEAPSSDGIHHPDLQNALDALMGPTIGLVGLPKEWLDDEHELRIKGISVQRDSSNGVKSFVPKLTYKGPERQAVLNLAPLIHHSEMAETFQELLRAAVAEAVYFVNGAKRIDPQLGIGEKEAA